MNIKSIKEFMVFDGSKLDVDASLKVCERAMLAYRDTMMLSEDKFKEACDTVFDKYKDRANVPKAFDMIKRELPLNPDNSAEIEKALRTYINANTGEYGESLYGSQRGRNGGSWRWSDKNEKSPEVVESLKEIAERNSKVKAVEKA